MKDSSLTTTTITLMIGVAIFFDLVQFFIDLFHLIPVIGNAFAAIITALLSVFAFMVFWFWFTLHDIKFNTSKRLISMGGGFIIELVPILNALPAWTLAVILVITTTKIPQIAKIAAASQGKIGKPALVTGTEIRTQPTRNIQPAPYKREGKNNNTRNFDGIRPTT